MKPHSLGKLRGMPMVLSTGRKDSKCRECKIPMKKGEKIYRPLLDAEVGGLIRCDRVCVECMNSLGVMVADS